MRFSLAAGSALNPNGAVNGGILAAALDHVLATAALLAMPGGCLPNTANLNVQYLRPAFAPLDLVAAVTKTGGSLVFAAAEVYDGDGVVCATSDGTFVVLDATRANSPRRRRTR